MAAEDLNLFEWLSSGQEISAAEGEKRVGYGEEIVKRLAADLSARYRSGFSVRNVWQMKAFYLAWMIRQTPSAEFFLSDVASRFPLPVKNLKLQYLCAVMACGGAGRGVSCRSRE